MARKINFGDIIGPVSDASSAQKAALRTAIGTGTGGGDDFTNGVTLTHVFGTGASGTGRQAVSPALLATAPPLSFLLRSNGSGQWEAGSAATARSLLDLGGDGRGEVKSAAEAIADDTLMSPDFGLAVLKAIRAARLYEPTKAEADDLLDDAGVLYTDAELVEASLIAASQDGTAEVEGIIPVNVAGGASALLAGTANAIPDAAAWKSLMQPRAVSSSSGDLVIDFTDGINLIYATTESAEVSFSGLPGHFPGSAVVVGGGAHTITFDSGIKVIPDTLEGGLTVASGEVYTMAFIDDGTWQIVVISPVAGTAT